MQHEKAPPPGHLQLDRFERRVCRAHCDRAALPQELHPPGVRRLLIRHGLSCRVPAKPPVERDEEKVTGWGEGDLDTGGRAAAALDAWIVFEDESGSAMGSVKISVTG
ncbi:helix-turn-helix domain-containing protein [Streptomyces sp. cg40]|uniref:helix-turn-helix domain-containing protein n=1 Tax=Streptomyces sp. cg40 TaxID=3419764 RepID=UPI003CFE0652